MHACSRILGWKNALKSVPPSSRWFGPCNTRYAKINTRKITTESQSKVKPYYVTTPIFYVNAAPHIGHLYTLVLTDVFKRWRAVLGETDAQMLTGTDEHGIKIQKAATLEGVGMKDFCDENCRKFEKLVKIANINHDYFIRTTDADHKRAVRHAWRELNQKGYIYEAKHEGWYSIGDETFVPESAVHLIIDPPTGRKFMASIETGREVEWSSETNYHFKLSAFKERLLDFYQNNPKFITPAFRMKEVIQSVADGLEDLSISRPRERLSWGIPVPDDESQTIYVWIDALMNYATRAGYPFGENEGSAKGWPPNLQVIGKDIMRFHCVYWPALLMALELPLPKQILSHAHWTMMKKKMSKSEGNVVNPFFAIDRFGLDVIRYYLIHDGGVVDDASYDNSYIVREYKKGLQGGLGNLASRILRPKLWNVRRAIERARDQNLPPMSRKDKELRDFPRKLWYEVKNQMEELNCRGALHSIMDMIYQTNAYVQHTSPWNLVRDEAARDNGEADAIIYNAAETVRIAAILLQPFMPDRMDVLLDMLGVDPTRRTIKYATLGGDFEYGIPKIALGSGMDGVLFPILACED